MPFLGVSPKNRTKDIGEGVRLLQIMKNVDP
jgi:hypothetical protein